MKRKQCNKRKLSNQARKAKKDRVKFILDAISIMQAIKSIFEIVQLFL